MCSLSKGGKAASQQANQARADEIARQQRVQAGTDAINNTFSQFDDAYYDKQRQGYLDFALPQLDDQYGNAQKQLTFSLARDGNLDSSARASQFADLQKAYDTNRTSIADQGQSYANQARNSVEDARSNLITTLNATGDATGASNSSIARAAALSQPAAYSPIGDAFSSITGALATGAQAAKLEALSNGAYKAPYSGLFGTSSNSVVNKR